MANRDQLRIIRAARAGDTSAQLALGRHYLFGGDGLPQNYATALYWLDRAANQQVQEAWILIGTHISFDVAQRAANMPRLLEWYEKAFDAGVMQAGPALAQLVQARHGDTADPALREKAARAMQAAERAGIADAHHFVAQHGDETAAPAPQPEKRPASASSAHPTGAAEAALHAARRALAERAWAIADYASFLRWTLPHARNLARRSAPRPG